MPKYAGGNCPVELEKAVQLLNNIDQIFINSDIIKKRQIIGSIYPEKLVFDENRFPTSIINEAVRLIFNNNEGLREIKIGQVLRFSDLSNYVGLPGFEPRQTGPKPVVLPLYYKPVEMIHSTLKRIAKIMQQLINANFF